MSAPASKDARLSHDEEEDGEDEPTQIRLSGEEPDLAFAPAEGS